MEGEKMSLKQGVSRFVAEHAKRQTTDVVGQEPVILDASGSVDWLTVTVKRPAMRDRLLAEAMRLKEMYEAQGNRIQKWGMKGYRGWMCAGLRWGTRQDDDILMVSGQAAQVNWQPALEMADNVSRLDLACTLTLAEPMLNVALRAYSLIITDPNKCEGCGKRKFSYVENSLGGQTLYVGSRASDQFGRVYDKGLESTKDPLAPAGVIWRYEVEFKSYRAKKVATSMLSRSKIDDLDDVADDIQHTVSRWFLGRGVNPIWTPGDGLAWALDIEAKVTDDEATLKWITTQVRPSVGRLVDRGKKDQVLEALGITVLRQDDLDKAVERGFEDLRREVHNLHLTKNGNL